MYKKYEKVCGWTLLGLMCASLLLVICLGRYNHPTGDDYYYGAATKKVLAETGSILETVKEAAKGVAYQYENWQGTYSAMFLMYLPPNLFGEGAYRLVTGLILFLYTAGVFYFLRPVICHWLKGSGSLWCAVSAAFVLLTIQTVPFKGESFFWYNGSMYYTGYFAAALLYGGVVCRYLISSEKWRLPILILLAAFLAGGNYVSLLPCILLTVTVTVILAGRHSEKSIWMGIITFVMIAGLLISAAAPGNRMRESNLWEMSAWKAILKSLIQGVLYLEAWLGRWWLMTVIVLTPLFWHTYGKVTWKFRYPILVTGYFFGIFCSMSCPTFYAMNSTGPARVLAIVYYGFMLFSLAAYYYLLGFFYRWCEQTPLTAHAAFGEPKDFRMPCLIAMGAFLFLMVMQIAAGEWKECTSVKAAQLLWSGEAAAYEQEYQERLKILRDDQVQNVVFQPYEHQPEMLFVGDFQGNTENVNNRKVAEYFGKETIMVQY